MAAITSPAPRPQHAQILITGAAGVATKIFDATPVQGSAGATGELWDVYIENLDAVAANAVFIGFTSTVDVADGFSIPGGAAGGISPNQILLLRAVPWFTKIFANCTAAATRDIRIIAIPG